jgi:hypothetical protein
MLKASTGLMPKAKQQQIKLALNNYTDKQTMPVFPKLTYSWNHYSVVRIFVRYRNSKSKLNSLARKVKGNQERSYMLPMSLWRKTKIAFISWLFRVFNFVFLSRLKIKYP